MDDSYHDQMAFKYGQLAEKYRKLGLLTAERDARNMQDNHIRLAEKHRRVPAAAPDQDSVCKGGGSA